MKMSVTSQYSGFIRKNEAANRESIKRKDIYRIYEREIIIDWM
jgi:hypothetical protein